MSPISLPRRCFIGRSLALLACSAFVPAWASRPQSAFALTDYQKSIAEIVGGAVVKADEKNVRIILPEIAENGGQVRVEVEVDLPKVESISLLVEKNPVPLTSQFIITKNSMPYVSVNLKVRETSEVMALVKADGRFYSAAKSVRVTAGGCG